MQDVSSHTEADRYLFERLTQQDNCHRMAMTAKLTKGAKRLSLMGLKHRFGHFNKNEFAQKVAQTWLGSVWQVAFDLSSDPMTWIQDSLELALQLHPIFERLGIKYYVTDGVAATTYGEPRTTMDLDLVISVSGAELYPLVEALESENFYVPGVEEAVLGQTRTLQITHQETIARADLMMAGTENWDTVKFSRRQLISGIYLASPEDVILNKLRWREQSLSEKQWRDVLGILKVQGAELDFEHLTEWASRLGIEAVLAQAKGEAGLS
ncbi:MAG: hypothetical protein AAF766_09565 [Cyanobacteria bacterium P01_D01_bin.14]